MSRMQTMDGHASHRPDTAPVDQKLEVVIIPVSDVDRAKKFYEGLGWRADRPEAPLVRVVRGLHRCARARENS